MQDLIKASFKALWKVQQKFRVQKFSNEKSVMIIYQRWSRGHKARGQGQPFRGQTLSRPRTGMLEAKAKDQGHKRKCSPKKKKVFAKIFQAISKKKKRSSQKIFK